MGGNAQQREAAELIRTAFLIRFAESIIWPHEDRLDDFAIGIFEDDSTMIGTVERVAKRVIVRGKPIRVVRLQTGAEARNVQMLFLDETRSMDVSRYMLEVDGAHVLVVSTEGEPRYEVMINLVFNTNTRKISYELNSRNVAREGLLVTPELLLLGGSKIDTRELFRQSEDSIRIERERVERQRIQLAEQEQVLNQQNTEIQSQRYTIRMQDRSIAEGRLSLDSLAIAYRTIEQELQQSTALLGRQERKIRTLGDTIVVQQAQVLNQGETLRRQQDTIDVRRLEIERQEEALSRQSSTIEEQRRMLAVVISFVAVLVVLLIVLYRSYKTIRRINSELELKNLTIGRQKEALERQAHLLTVANEELESFSYSVSHDLRAPLRSIHGFGEALREEYSTALGPEGIDYLNRVQVSARKMSALIDDLLKLSHVGRQSIQRNETDLAPIARSILADFQKNEPERLGDMIVAESAPAFADARLLTIVLQNLLGNAWKFTARVARTRIEFGMESGGSSPVYFVRDNGAGFNPAYRDRLFAPFQRLHADEDFAGSGIGLSIVQRIIHRHGGDLWADGAPGEGAVFRFTLPHTQEEMRG